MGSAVLHFLILPALLHSAPLPDTTTYLDRATQQLVARGMERHHQQDSSVRDYQAKLRYRVSFGFARRKWGDPIPAAVEEQDAHLVWQLPNDLRIDMLGRRSASQFQGIDLSSTFAHPWFVPRTLGDSLRIFGASETPDRAAPHPLAPGADQYYRYAAGDSVTITTGGRRITIQSVTVTPKLTHGSFVAGRLWLDVSSGDVVRFTFRFVGTELWARPDGDTPRDSASARRASGFVSRILEVDADLEFSLQDNRYWMPFREVIAGKVTVPFGVDFAIPFQAQTTFDDYVINSGARVVFDAAFPRDSTARGRNGGRILAGGGRRPPPGGRPPAADTVQVPRDATRPRLDTAAARLRFRNRTGYLADGGRYEIHRPPPDSMRRYQGWGDSLLLQQNPQDRRRVEQAVADLGRLSEQLPGAMTGRPGAGFAPERIADVLRYNRVEGTTLSLAAHAPLPISFGDIYGTVRYGFADQRVMARVAMIRDAPAGRLIVAASRDLMDTDPYADGLSLGNSVRGIFTGHDDGAYLLGQGVRLSYETSRGPGTELRWRAIVEDQRSVTTQARSWFARIGGGDGYFPATDPVREGFAAGGGLRVDHTGHAVEWITDLDGLAVAGRGAGRLAAEVRLRPLARGWISARVKAGVAVGSDSVPQLALRAGGLNTVRGYDFGVTQGDLLWATQLDISRPTRKAVRLIGFIDAGQAGARANFGSAPFLSGTGVGISILGGFMRANLSHPITNTAGRGVRFDLLFGSIR
jgi:hypothetical protein